MRHVHQATEAEFTQQFNGPPCLAYRPYITAWISEIRAGVCVPSHRPPVLDTPHFLETRLQLVLGAASTARVHASDNAGRLVLVAEDPHCGTRRQRERTCRVRDGLARLLGPDGPAIATPGTVAPCAEVEGFHPIRCPRGRVSHRHCRSVYLSSERPVGVGRSAAIGVLFDTFWILLGGI